MTTATLPASAAPGASVRLQIEGMTCAPCVNRVERALRKVPGVAAAEVNLATETAEVPLSRPAPAIDEALTGAGAKAGYQAQVLREDAPAAGHEPQPHAAWPVVAAAVLSLPLVLQMVAM